MIVYLVERETKKIIKEFSNVIKFGENFVEYIDVGRCKIYCSEKEFFTNDISNI